MNRIPSLALIGTNRFCIYASSHSCGFLIPAGKTLHPASKDYSTQNQKNRMNSDELLKLSKEELVEKVKKLQEESRILKARPCAISKFELIRQKFNKYESKSKRNRTFDHTACGQQKIALKVSYFGWDYMGLQDNPGLEDTIEKIVFEALIRTKLLISEGDERGYSKCGRTDKGVSAFSQVMCLKLRSVGEHTTTNEDSHPPQEIDYCSVINSVLPEEIKVTAWAPVDDIFSARHHCNERVYKYFFPIGSLDIKKMNDAAKLFIGSHDFRNFCKMNVQETTVFVREIRVFDIRLDMSHDKESPYHMCEATINGSGFLYHQVRYMMGILFLIGIGFEEPSIISDLLDVETMPKKPQYGMMADFPLTLHDCSFDNLKWNTSEKATKKLLEHFQRMWATFAIKSALAKSMLEKFNTEVMPLQSQVVLECTPRCSINIENYAINGFLLSEKSTKQHVNLIKRGTALSLEEKIDNLEKRKQRQIDNSSNTV